jgi:uncharacterized protein YkwD
MADNAVVEKVDERLHFRQFGHPASLPSSAYSEQVAEGRKELVSMQRLTRTACAVIAAAVLGAVAPPPATAAPTPAKHVRTYDKHLLKYVNNARANNGLKPLKQSNRLYKIAHRWAAHLAKSHDNLEHNPKFVLGGPLVTRTCPHATAAGENVGAQAQTAPKSLFKLYMDEPYHRANILSPKYNSRGTPRYTYVGIATVKASDGSEWNVMDFANHCR